MPRAAQVLPEIDEATFQEQVMELLRLNGWTLRYHVYDSRKSAAGFPDICAVRLRPAPARCVFLELKSEKGQASPEQIVWIEALNKCPGIEARICRPSDWDSLVELLKRPRVVS